jgi:hypothetical protein
MVRSENLCDEHICMVRSEYLCDKYICMIRSEYVYTPFYCPAKRTNTQTKREHTETPTLSMIDSASASDVYDNVSGYVCDYDLDEAYRKYVKDK